MGQSTTKLFQNLKKELDAGNTKLFEKHAEEIFKRFDKDKSGTYNTP